MLIMAVIGLDSNQELGAQFRSPSWVKGPTAGAVTLSQDVPWQKLESVFQPGMARRHPNMAYRYPNGILTPKLKAYPKNYLLTPFPMNF